MKLHVSGSVPAGRVDVPPSKSHTIRGVFLAALSSGTSLLRKRLQSADGDSAIEACRALGIEITEEGDTLTVQGTGGVIKPVTDTIDVGNSGTTARFVLSMAALCPAPITVIGDASTSSRPMGGILNALANLGATVVSSNNGKLPVTLHGPVKGGHTQVDGATSQYISSLLTHAAFFENDSEFTLEKLNEQPYVEITLGWLDRLGIAYTREGFSRFTVKAGQRIEPFDIQVPADFSSATFFLALSAIPGAEVELAGLDLNDTQGDKKVIDYLKEMGADIETGETVKVRGRRLQGRTIDMNSTPDALPAMAVVGCLADGETRLTNVPQARIKETDRIAVMAAELKKMGADIEEEPDGLVIRSSRLNGAAVNGHHDHRVVMSLAVAGMAAEGETVIDTAEAMRITFPDFVEKMRQCGATMTTE